MEEILQLDSLYLFSLFNDTPADEEHLVFCFSLVVKGYSRFYFWTEFLSLDVLNLE